MATAKAKTAEKAPKKRGRSSTSTSAAVSVKKSTAKKTASSRVTKSKAEDEVTTTEDTPKRTLKISKKWITMISLFVVVVGLVYLASRYLVVAMVDGQPITRFELINSLEKRYGNDLREQMIVEKLILSEAQKKGITISEEEITSEIKKLEEQQGGADQLNQILQVQGISQDEFKKLIRLQLIRQKLFGDTVTISDEEVDKYLEENKDSLPEATPGAQEKLRADVREQLKQQKVGTDFNTWLQSQLQSERIRRL